MVHSRKASLELLLAACLALLCSQAAELAAAQSSSSLLSGKGLGKSTGKGKGKGKQVGRSELQRASASAKLPSLRYRMQILLL